MNRDYISSREKLRGAEQANNARERIGIVNSGFFETLEPVYEAEAAKYRSLVVETGVQQADVREPRQDQVQSGSTEAKIIQFRPNQGVEDTALSIDKIQGQINAAYDQAPAAEEVIPWWEQRKVA